MEYIKNPNKIEKNSFEIITEIIKKERPEYKFKNETEEKIIKRAIHTTADFEYLDILKISDCVIDKITESLKNGATIYTDTNMALSGINKKILDRIGCKYRCLVSEDETAEYAKKHQITRSMAAVELSALDKSPKIYVFGNAPTAIFKVIEMYKENNINLEAVIGVPVGFVGAAESKEALQNTDINYIVSKGRKGGSNLAAAIINAILYDKFGR